MAPNIGSKVILDRSGLDRLIADLRGRGYRVIGPVLADSAVIYDEIQSAADLPAGCRDDSEAGTYRLDQTGEPWLFGYTLGVQGWKRHLYPPRQRLFRAERGERGFRLLDDQEVEAPLALLGVRACELAAIQVLDGVFDHEGFTEPGYLRRRQNAFIVAVECGHAAATCFCASADTGPAVGQGYDLRLNEIAGQGNWLFVAEAGSEKGLAVLAELPSRPASPDQIAAAAAQPQQAASQQSRQLKDDAARVLAVSTESPYWDKVAERCLTCGNCTMVCPTCFCTSVEDVTDLAGDIAERWRRWDSCFTLDYSYIHGGNVRSKAASRYRQWITHKLATWHHQFGRSGCVGCGRCIAWCPVGIDITAEVRALADAERGR